MPVQLVAVERRLWSGTATMVVAKTTEGELGILPGHQPLLGQLVEGGVLRITTTDGETVAAVVQGGFLSVSHEGVSILAESAELAHEIDIEAAKIDAESTDDLVRTRAIGRLRAAGQTV
ncbi:F0F1 ATP synthase subunit epsilon [Pseudonocardiaceae bacterium YIM PH 21723]|nr:F0F1 ATP synthase subunit epsilon [Pseudonocardiaceae bacterium YIM PH 21723]